MGTLRIMDGSGDVRSTWDPANHDEVAAAKEQFDKMTRKGYNAYRVDKGEKGGVIKEFDPAAGSIILAAPMAGG